ncbi:MAG: hypothetical protein K5897_06660 [Eubacterium sp.]|nr:hypothetical protein [Eubacterium sp.]
MKRLIVDRPNTRADVQQVLDYMKENNTVIFAVPALVLTDEENAEKDLEYLSDPWTEAVGILRYFHHAGEGGVLPGCHRAVGCGNVP